MNKQLDFLLLEEILWLKDNHLGNQRRKNLKFSWEIALLIWPSWMLENLHLAKSLENRSKFHSILIIIRWHSVTSKNWCSTVKEVGKNNLEFKKSPSKPLKTEIEVKPNRMTMPQPKITCVYSSNIRHKACLLTLRTLNQRKKKRLCLYNWITIVSHFMPFISMMKRKLTRTLVKYLYKTTAS